MKFGEEKTNGEKKKLIGPASSSLQNKVDNIEQKSFVSPDPYLRIFPCWYKKKTRKKNVGTEVAIASCNLRGNFTCITLNSES